MAMPPAPLPIRLPGGSAERSAPPSPHPLSAARDLNRRITRRWLVAWGLLLAGLAVGGRGFAYIGLPPLFISELVLLSGVAVLFLQPRWKELFSQPTVLCILVLMAWSTLQTLPYLGRYGIDALRDLVLVGYAAVGITVCGVLMSRPEMLGWIVEKYAALAKVILVAMPVLWVLDQAISDHMPGWPWAPTVGIINLKPGDLSVHLGVIAGLMILGLFRGRSLLWTALLCLLLAMTGAVNRGGLVAFGAAFGVAFFARPVTRWASRLILIIALGMSLALISDLSIPVPGRDREFSARQIMLNLYTIVGDDSTGDLDDTKQWRLNWWNTIIGYTFQGDYFWTGKGFGINLANSDGFQVYEDESLRSPHNSHMTILARAGVPGLALWITLQASWLYAILNGYLKARQKRDANWASLFVLLLAYWTAMMINASFDVYFEGPMGGIWYWSVLGVGLAAAWIYPRRPEVLHVPAATPGEA